MAALPIWFSLIATLIVALVVRIVSVVLHGRRNRRTSVGFFHPYTNDGGGGERVLWCAVKAVQEEFPGLECVVYTGDHDATPATLSARAIDRFGVKLINSPKVLPLERLVDPMKIISVAQFRPEKAHQLQVEAFALAIKSLDANLPRPKLQFVGSCRNEADEKRLQHLKDQTNELKLDSDVEFHKNVKYSELVNLLGGATAGIHSMTDEHFGISVVEFMAAGAIPIAHNSAGPKMDIVLPEDGKPTGFLAQTEQEYADAILSIMRMPAPERLEMAAAARKRASRFSEQKFYQDFKAAIKPIMLHTTQ